MYLDMVCSIGGIVTHGCPLCCNVLRSSAQRVQLTSTTATLYYAWTLKAVDNLPLQASLSKMGIDPTAALERARSRSRSRVGRKRTRSVAGDDFHLPVTKPVSAPVPTKLT